MSSTLLKSDRAHEPHTVEDRVALSALPARSRARIVEVSAGAADATRLMALGVCVGRQVEIIKAGEPLIVSVVGARVGLSARLAACVLVQTNNAAASSQFTAAS